MQDFSSLTPSQVDEMRRCIKRELQKRKWFYPKWVESRKMTQEKADFEIAGIQKIANYFDWLQIHTQPEQLKLL